MKSFLQSKLPIAAALIMLASVLATPLFSSPVYAKECTAGTNALTLLPPWFKGLQCDDTTNSVLPPKDNGGLQAMILKIVLNIVEALLYVVGYISLGMIIWGGFKYMKGGDNPGEVEAAKKTILNAIIGLLISMFAIVIVNLVTGAF